MLLRFQKKASFLLLFAERMIAVIPFSVIFASVGY